MAPFTVRRNNFNYLLFRPITQYKDTGARHIHVDNYNMNYSFIYLFTYSFTCLFNFREGERERKRGRILSRLHTQRGAQRDAWSQNSGIITWAKIKSWTINWPSHPGTPQLVLFKVDVQKMIKLSLQWTSVFFNLDHKRYKAGVERLKTEQKMQLEILFFVIVVLGSIEILFL